MAANQGNLVDYLGMIFMHGQMPANMRTAIVNHITPMTDMGERARVAVGTFDGVHLGHREVIDGSECVLTFEPHPVSVVAPQHTPKLLTTPRRKAELIASLGVQEMVVIPLVLSCWITPMTESVAHSWVPSSQ